MVFGTTPKSKLAGYPLLIYKCSLCHSTVMYGSLNLKPKSIKKETNTVSKNEVWALVFPVRALIVPRVQYCRLVRRRSGENSHSGWSRRPLTGVGALPRYSQVRMYIGTTQRELNRSSHGYTTTTLVQWTAVKLGAKSGGLCNWWEETLLSWRNPLLLVIHPTA